MPTPEKLKLNAWTDWILMAAPPGWIGKPCNFRVSPEDAADDEKKELSPFKPKLVTDGNSDGN